MEKIIDLKELLKHEIMDLNSAEQQIIEALPTMIDKAKNEALKNALQQHLEITKEHKTRLEEIQELMTEQNDVQSSEQGGEQNAETASRKGFFSRVFGGGEQKCK